MEDMSPRTIAKEITLAILTKVDVGIYRTRDSELLPEQDGDNAGKIYNGVFKQIKETIGAD